MLSNLYKILYNVDIETGGTYMNQTLLDKYTKTFGTRFTRRQKNKFLRALDEDMKPLGYEPNLIKGKHLVSRANNYLYGNSKQMKTVLVIPYDTPEKKFWPKVIYFPMDGTKTTNKTMLATYFPLVFLFILVFLGVYIIQPRLKDAWMATGVSGLMFLLTLGLVYLMLHGVHNRKNYNRNSIAIAKAVELAQRMSKDERRRTGFLFTDKNRMRFLGAESSMKYLVEKGKNPNIIVLDCIGQGSQTKIGFNPQNRKLASELSKHWPQKKQSPECCKLQPEMRMQSAMSHFKKAIIISSGEVDKNGSLYVMHTGTGKDTAVDIALVDTVGEMLYHFIHAQK